MQVDPLMAPYRHVASLKSKGLRSVFIEAVAAVLGSTNVAHTKSVCAVVATLHNASLLLDDIEDGSAQRRGSPTAHTIYGTPLTINAANTAVFDALGSCIKMDEAIKAAVHSPPQREDVPQGFHATAVKAFQHELMELHRGQGQDLLWRDTRRCPTEELYDTMTKGKTGGLFRLAVRLLILHPGISVSDAEFARIHATLLELCDDLAVLFQVLDDYLNLQSDVYHSQKTFCEDLEEGKYSFLTMHAIHQQQQQRKQDDLPESSEDGHLEAMLAAKPTTVEQKQACLAVLRKYGAFSCAVRKVEGLGVACQTHLDILRSSCKDEAPERLGGVSRLRAFVAHLLGSIQPLPASVEATTP